MNSMSQRELLIELCRPHHAVRIAPLIQALAQEEGDDPAPVDEIVQVVEALLQTGASDFVLASVDGEPIGCLQIAYRLSTWQAQPYAYIEDFYLVPAMRRRGIGSKLIDYALQRAEGQRADYIALDVRAANGGAIRLYEQLGFTNSGSIVLKRPLPLGKNYCDTTATLAAIEEFRGNGQAAGEQ
jgi:ribosomal protein S18 acetylase RimI-like enzyme